MIPRSLLTCVLCCAASSQVGAQSAWLPGAGQLIIAPGYSHQSFHKFKAGKTTVKLPARMIQQSSSLSLDYGLTPKVAADATLGYARVDFEPQGSPNSSQDGFDDARLGLRYRFLDDGHGGRAWMPAVAVRVGGTIAGSYEIATAFPPVSPGDGANGFETSLLFGKGFGKTGFGAYGDLGYRLRDQGVPDEVFGSVGLFKYFGGLSLTVGYRHIEGIRGGDIGGPGFGVSYGFTNVREVNQLIESGIAYTDRGGRSYQFVVAQTIAGRNTGEKLVFGFTLSIPVQIGR